MNQTYITEKEREKYQKVSDAFTELYDMADIVVVDVGRYGFVMLKYYKPPHGFEEDETFTDSRALFAGCGKSAFAFPQAVNGVSISSYSHFHDAVLKHLKMFA